MAKKDDSVFEDAPPVEKQDITPLDSDLSTLQKAEFAALLREGIPLSVRASRLIHLSSLTGTKTAPVALRAIQEINSLTGITADTPDEGSPMFILPDGMTVGVAIKIPKK